MKSEKRSKKTVGPSMIRQGDVLLMRVTKVDGEIEDAPKDARGIVLAEGETSGHFHAVFGKSGRGEIKLMRFKDARAERLLVVGDGEGATVRVVGGGAGGVDRHTPIEVGPGTFKVRIQRAWDSSSARQVQD